MEAMQHGGTATQRAWQGLAAAYREAQVFMGDRVTAGKTDAQKRMGRLLKLAQRDGFFCRICLHPIDLSILDHQRPDYVTFDHVRPKRAGGTSALENLRLTHKICNNQRCNGPKGIRKVGELVGQADVSDVHPSVPR